LGIRKLRRLGAEVVGNMLQSQGKVHHPMGLYCILESLQGEDSVRSCLERRVLP